MAKKSKSMIGHDPLAWLKEDAEDAEIIEEVKEMPKAKKKAAKKKTAKSKAAAEQAEDNVFELQSVQDISSVAELKEDLKGLFKYEKVILDVSNVERIDTTSLQLLYAFIEEAKVNSLEIAWNSPSEAMTNSARLLGMEEVLQLSNVA